MEAHTQLRALYQEWRELSEREAEAIQTAFWSKVTKCQEAKKELQRRIVSITEVMQSEIATLGLSQSVVDDEMRRIVDELILLESRNGDLLADQRERGKKEESELERSSRNLRQVHRAYAGQQTAAWQSYS